MRSNVILRKGPAQTHSFTFFEILQATINTATDPSDEDVCLYILLNIVCLLLSLSVAAHLVLCPEQWRTCYFYLLVFLEVIILTEVQWL